MEFGKSDLLIAKIEPEAGKIILNDKERRWIGSTEWISLNVTEDEVTPAFLKYLLLNPKVLEAFSYLKSGKNQARLPVRELLYLNMPVPPIDVQRKIEQHLSRIDREIMVTVQSIKTFSTICDEVFSDHFNIPRLDSPLQHFISTIDDVGQTRLMRIGVRHSAFEIKVRKLERAVPKWVSLRSVARVRGGKRLRKGSRYATRPTKFRYLRNTDIENGKIKLKAVKYITRAQHKSIERYQVFKNEIVMAIAGTVGKVALIPKELGICNATENLAIISPKRPSIAKYLTYLLASSIVQIQAQKEMSELRQQKLGLEKIRKLKLPKLPRKNVRKRIVEKIDNQINQQTSKIKLVQNLLSQALQTVEDSILH